MTNSPHWKGEMEAWRWLEDCNVLQVLSDKVLLEFPSCGRTWMEWVPRRELVGSGADLDEQRRRERESQLRRFHDLVG